MILPPWAQALQQYAPDAERWLVAAFKGTGLLQDRSSDLVLAAAIALAFPAVRWLMDRSVYEVRCMFYPGFPGHCHCWHAARSIRLRRPGVGSGRVHRGSIDDSACPAAGWCRP